MIFRKVAFCSIFSLILGNALCVDLDPITENVQKVCVSEVKGLYKEDSEERSIIDQNLFKDLAPTLAIMKMFLKDDFKPLTGDKAGVKKNLRDNVEAFFGSEKFIPHRGGRQEIILDRELTDILCDLIKREQKEALKGNVTLYHGMTGSNLFVYKYFARLFSQILQDRI